MELFVIGEIGFLFERFWTDVALKITTFVVDRHVFGQSIGIRGFEITLRTAQHGFNERSQIVSNTGWSFCGSGLRQRYVWHCITPIWLRVTLFVLIHMFFCLVGLRTFIAFEATAIRVDHHVFQKPRRLCTRVVTTWTVFKVAFLFIALRDLLWIVDNSNITYEQMK